MDTKITIIDPAIKIKIATESIINLAIEIESVTESMTEIGFAIDHENLDRFGCQSYDYY